MAGLATGSSAASTASELPSGVGDGSRTHAGAATDPLFAPGRVGPIRVGMSSRQAVATGLVRRNPNPGCGEQRLMGRGYLERHLLIFSRPGRGITEMLTARRRLHAGSNVGIGTTLRRLRVVYGDRLSRPVEGGYAQWTVHVRREHRHIGFLLGRAYTRDGPAKPRDRVTLMAVTKRHRSGLAVDGC